MEILCKTSAETEAVGRWLGKYARSGDVFCLSGDLGAGKTLLCRGVAAAQGVDPAAVTSPTFTLMNVYQGRENELRHFDLYRLNRPEELTDIGFEEYAGGEGITLIEWAELFPGSLPEAYLQITLTMVPEGRKISLAPRGARYVELLETMKKEGQPTC
jgi:tRNA threonylcarbamoyladenosine biosynthesis protein TsaE